MAECGSAHERWHRRTARRFRHSLRWRLVLMFLLLALAMAAVFVGGMQRAIGQAWRAAARPLVADYVDRLVADLGTPPSVEQARRLVERLPLTLRIEGPQVQWDSHPGDSGRAWPRREDEPEAGLLVRHTADGHRIVLGLGGLAWDRHPRTIGWLTLAALLALTAGAYAYVRRLLRPLEDIRAGALRFGRGEFGAPIPVRRHDELGELAQGVNTMAADIHRMLEAKRGLLLAISHELRSPLTRARLHAELLPEDAALRSMREPLLRDLQLMRDLISDLLESERLASPHAALQLEAVDLAALAREVVDGMAQPAAPAATVAPAAPVELQTEPGLPAALRLDPARLRLLLRNLLGNAQRHGAGTPVLLRLAPVPGGVLLQVRDHGPGVDDAALARLAEPFYRPDSARQRSTGGVGLGLYLCRLVAQAHGGRLALRNAAPGLEVSVHLPG